MLNLLGAMLTAIAMLGFGRWIAGRNRFYFDDTSPHARTRYESLDGLRGFLAMGVFLHHSMFTFFFLKTGTWDSAHSRPFALMGTSSIVFFFLITGFIFWSKAIAAEAKRPKIIYCRRRSAEIQYRAKRFARDALHLYRGRILRVAPMYLLTVFVIIAVILAETGRPARGELLGFSQGIARLLCLGGIDWHLINGIDPLHINAGVTWTLQYEWWFYLALPFMALFTRPRHFAVLAVIYIAGNIFLHRLTGLKPPIVFIFGMGIAQLLSMTGPVAFLRGKSVSVICLLGLIAMPMIFSSGLQLGAYLAASAVFYCIANGNTFFGLLTMRSSKMLGTLSYSIYLSHGIFLYLARNFLKPASLADQPGIAYWLGIAATGLIITGSAAITYRLVEYPFIAMGRKNRRPVESAPIVIPDAATPLISTDDLAEDGARSSLATA
jgi:peptidoglycan/LPS O-acetylase OafA/YrhL